MRRQVLVLSLAVLTQGLWGVASNAALSCDGDFHLARRFDFGRETSLEDVTVAETGEVWALGSYRAGGEYQTLVLNRTADGWQQVPFADPEGAPFDGTGIDVDETGAVWLSGFRFEEDLIESSAVLRYDGTDWSDIPTPDFPFDSPLWDIEVISPNDVWAVGAFEHPETQNEETLALHYDGGSFTQVSTPSPGFGAALGNLDATSPVDVWAVGDSDRRELALHWDGSGWTERRLPDLRNLSTLLSIAAHVDGRAWVVGLGDRYKLRSKLLEWEGSAWKKIRIPNPDGHDFLAGIDIRGSIGWAVGERRAVKSNDFALAWNGTTWTRARASDPGESSALSKVAIDADGIAWAVGYFYVSEGDTKGMLQKACT